MCAPPRNAVSTRAAALPCVEGLQLRAVGATLESNDRRGDANGKAADGSKGATSDTISAAAEADAISIDRLQVRLAFGDAETAKLRQLCHARGLDGDVVLRMLELEQEVAGMGKRRGLRLRLRDLIDELGEASRA